MHRSSIRLLILSATASVCAPMTHDALSRDPTGVSERPNIVYIMADDAGYGDFSCYGQQRFSTPHIDRLAREGMRFTQHYSGSTVCAPTRCSLMTGKHTGHCSIRGNRPHKPFGQRPMDGTDVTVAELLGDAGYATGAFGKWGLGHPVTEGDPLKQGFDRFYGYNCQANAHTYYPTWLFDDAKQIELDGETYARDLILEQALEFIRASQHPEVIARAREAFAEAHVPSPVWRFKADE